MGQKIHPLGFRVGITKKHQSQWFAETTKYPELILEDYFLRKLLNEKFSDAKIESIEIIRDPFVLQIKIHADNPEKITGTEKKNLQLLEKLLQKKLLSHRLQNFNIENIVNSANFQIHSKFACSQAISEPFSKFLLVNQPLARIQHRSREITRAGKQEKLAIIPLSIFSQKIIINVTKIVNSYMYANLVADFLIERLEKRAPFRQVIKTAVQRCELAKVKGVKIKISGRLNGAEIARSESEHNGRVPLHTLRADIDYSYKIAKTPYGILGIKVWIFNGDIRKKK